MNIPKTTHKKVKYRNGEFGHLLTTERTETAFSVLTLREKHDSIIHHLKDGRVLMSGEDGDLDVVWIN